MAPSLNPCVYDNIDKMQEENPQQKHRNFLKDIIELALLVVLVFVGSFLINLTIFGNFSVVGPSMEPTLYTQDRIIVNRLPISWAFITGQTYSPQRGEIIVFNNPHRTSGTGDTHVVKRVVAFAGERVVVKNGTVIVFSDGTHDSKKAIDPYAGTNAPKTGVDGEVDEVVPEGEIFVIGDHHQGNYSLDSRNGLGTVPLKDIIGPVAFRIFPLNQMRSF